MEASATPPVGNGGNGGNGGQSCDALRRDLEQHIFYGDPPDILARLSSIKHMLDRRLFHVLVGVGDDYRLYEYERNGGTRYALRVAMLNAEVAEELLAEFPRIALENRGKQCAGRLFQNSRGFESLQFEELAEQELAIPQESLAGPITAGWGQESSPDENDAFHRVAVIAEC
jgi:hypothetical protein